MGGWREAQGWGGGIRLPAGLLSALSVTPAVVTPAWQLGIGRRCIHFAHGLTLEKLDSTCLLQQDSSTSWLAEVQGTPFSEVWDSTLRDPSFKLQQLEGTIHFLQLLPLWWFSSVLLSGSFLLRLLIKC